jgi:acyl dehydratase
MTSLFRGVAVDGEDVDSDVPEAVPAMAETENPLATRTLDVPATAAHVYTECARIWNPIHTDAAVARAAGLPGIILHGTATLALAVSAVLELAGGIDPRQVRRIGGRFSAMVTMPNTLKVRLLGRQDRFLAFDVCTAEGARAVTRGLVETRADTQP